MPEDAPDPCVPRYCVPRRALLGTGLALPALLAGRARPARLAGMTPPSGPGSLRLTHPRL